MHICWGGRRGRNMGYKRAWVSVSMSWLCMRMVQVHSCASFLLWSHAAVSTSGQSPAISLSLYQSFKKYIWEMLAQKVQRLHLLLALICSSCAQFCHRTNNTIGLFWHNPQKLSEICNIHTYCWAERTSLPLHRTAETVLVLEKVPETSQSQTYLAEFLMG